MLRVCAGWTARRARMRAASWLAACVSLHAFASFATEGPRQALLPGAGGVHFVDEARCHTCHADATRAWAGSDHALAMQVADATTVLGDFDDAKFSAHGVESRFFRKGERYFVHTEGPDGSMRDFEVTHTFGVRPLQQYLVPFPGGRLQALDIAWDVERRKWFTLRPDERIAADDALHWTGGYASWNAMCAECHSTDLRKGYDPEADRYDTTYAAINVGCQACHGPGARHVAWAESRASAEPAPGSAQAAAPYGLVVDAPRADAAAQVDQCARCHALRHRVSPEDQHGRAFFDDFAPRLLDAGLYHADGQIDAEVYVYGSFVQSRMHRAGVGCSDCHDPHGAGLRAAGDALCVRCHQSDPGAALRGRFPTLPTGEYASKAHHHHAPESEAARCVTCHMPEKTYMEVDPRRDHSLRVPRPDLSARFGVPDPCSGCHAEHDAAWASRAIEAWYGPKRTRGADFTGAFHDARAGDPASAAALSRIAGDPDAAPIVRATALGLLGRVSNGTATGVLVEAALRDPDPIVREAAVGTFEAVAPADRLARLAPLLADPTRAVRVEAARLLAAAPRAALDPADAVRFDAAIAEWVAAQRAVADTAAAWLNLGVYHAEQGRFDAAVAAYTRAIRMDRRFLPAWANLAQLQAAAGRLDAAEKALREAITVDPEYGEFHYSLGLLLAEQGRMQESRDALAQAARRMPQRPRVLYNLGLAEQHLGRMNQAEQALGRARSLAPQDASILQALAIVYAQQKEWDAALYTAEQWAALYPDDRNAHLLLQQIRAQHGRTAN